MILYIDIGNSRIRFATSDHGMDYLGGCYYQAETLPSVFYKYTTGLRPPQRVVVANVAGIRLASMLTELCEHLWSLTPEYLTASLTGCGVTNAYINPGQLGVDRWMVMIAAWNRYRDNLCIFDCGSAVTADLVSAKGHHLGGYIIPGSYMMQQVLVNTTAQIVLEGEYRFSEQAGRSTGECVYNGTILAVVAFIEQIFNSINAGDDKYNCVITGGGAETIMKFMKIEYRHEPLLVLEGIRLTAV